jgi:hypothetical protein
MACFFLYLGYAGLRRGSGLEAEAARKAVTMVAAELSQARIARWGVSLLRAPVRRRRVADFCLFLVGRRRVEERPDRRLAPASNHCEELP